jgi:TonB family protein
LGLCSEILFSSDPVRLRLRLYEGIRDRNQAASSTVTSRRLDSFILKKQASDRRIQNEENKLKRIFNLEDLKLHIETDLVWTDNNPDRAFHVYNLSGIQVGLFIHWKGSNMFHLQIFEGDDFDNKDMNLLDTAVDLPPETTAVYGLEDRQGRPFFLSLFRSGVGAYSSRLAKRSVIKTVIPEYPARALERRIEGFVALEARVDGWGNVKDIRRWTGHPELVRSARNAFAGWKLMPAESPEEAEEVTMLLVFAFRLRSGEGGEPTDFRVELARFKQTDTWKKIEKDRERRGLRDWLLYLWTIEGDTLKKRPST